MKIIQFVNIHSMEILPLPAQKKRENFPEKQNTWKWFDLAKRCYLVHIHALGNALTIPKIGGHTNTKPTIRYLF
jgi:hypothetical protein